MVPYSTVPYYSVLYYFGVILLYEDTPPNSLGLSNIILHDQVATVINSVNCSEAPSCLKLNRNYCFSTANTCGSCLAGFKGQYCIYLSVKR
jgi:hypothetical protein